MSYRYLIQTFGCQMNVHDSERMGGVLRSHGGEPVGSPGDADVIVLNTCSVREKAEMKLRSEVGRLALLKRDRPDLVIVVAGCVAQQEGDALLRDAPYIDVVVGPDQIGSLGALVSAQIDGAPPIVRTVFDLDAPEFLPAPPLAGSAPASAFVTTMKGCDERCSFCIVPTTRGPERYRAASDILHEVRQWVARGTKEIVLLGQTVDSYRDPSLPAAASDDPDESQFPQLLRLLSDVPGLVRLRYTSPHPRHATESLAHAHRDLPVLARHIHMPVQSGSDRILRRMIRRYTRDEYIARLDRLKRAVPGMTFSTDVIVGFPGETEADFAETLCVVRDVGFVSLFGFKYSPRPGTPALRLHDDVPEEVKADRLARLLAAAEHLTSAHLSTLVGSVQQVLVEGASKSGVDMMQGRTERAEIVHIHVPEPAARVAVMGNVVAVRVLAANKHSLRGELLYGASTAPDTGAGLEHARSAPKRRLPIAAT